MNYNNNNTDFLIELRLNMEREIITLTNIIEQKKQDLIYITKMVDESCAHDWSDDNVDLRPEVSEGVSIRYCRNCMLSQ